jgi:DNA-binding HxlR family transcriptional regulator/putative sterol carrier protein
MTERWRGQGQYCPIARAAELLGERWTLLILRDILVGTSHFNDLARGLPGLSRSLLTKRLRALEHAEVIEHLDGRYLLTESGEALRPIVFALGEWGAAHTFGDPKPEELDPELLVWWMHRRIDTSGLPDRRTVLRVQFTDAVERFWIVIEHETPSVCVTDPGYEVDATIIAELDALYQVWLGRLPLRQAQREGRVRFDGTAAITRRMPNLLQLSPAAEMVRASATTR